MFACLLARLTTMHVLVTVVVGLLVAIELGCFGFSEPAALNLW